MSTRKSVSLRCTTTTQMGEAIELLLWGGFWGNTRAAVVERLLCHAVRDVLPPEALEVISGDNIPVATPADGNQQHRSNS